MIESDFVRKTFFGILPTVMSRFLCSLYMCMRLFYLCMYVCMYVCMCIIVDVSASVRYVCVCSTIVCVHVICIRYEQVVVSWFVLPLLKIQACNSHYTEYHIAPDSYDLH